MYFTTPQIQSLAPKPTSFKAGEKLAAIEKWDTRGNSTRALWGSIYGSGSKPYYVQVDVQDLAYKCSCPSRQFPCKHALALMLSYAISPDQAAIDEPEEVKEWIEKRRKKAEPKPEVELTEEQLEKKDVAKDKRLEDREKLVDAGVAELELWLKDLVRAGLLELPNKPASYYTTMAARLIDAKASGLAGWIKSLGKLDFSSQEIWFSGVCSIIAKLFLITQSWKNRNQLSPAWQKSIKNLVGWNQSTKDLLTADDALAIKDHWLVLGQQRESIEEIVIQRTWLYGLKENKTMLDLSFGTAFSPLENKFIVGKIMKAEVAFFDAQLPQRGIVRMTADHADELPFRPTFLDDVKSLYAKVNDLRVAYPWVSDEAFLMRNIQVVVKDDVFWAIDGNSDAVRLDTSFTEKSYMNWIMLTGNGRVDVSVVMKQQAILPLGVFINDKYQAL